MAPGKNNHDSSSQYSTQLGGTCAYRDKPDLRTSLLYYIDNNVEDNADG
jgi:hypothetical protein